MEGGLGKRGKDSRPLKPQPQLQKCLVALAIAEIAFATLCFVLAPDLPSPLDYPLLTSVMLLRWCVCLTTLCKVARGQWSRDWLELFLISSLFYSAVVIKSGWHGQLLAYSTINTRWAAEEEWAPIRELTDDREELGSIGWGWPDSPGPSIKIVDLGIRELLSKSRFFSVLPVPSTRCISFYRGESLPPTIHIGRIPLPNPHSTLYLARLRAMQPALWWRPIRCSSYPAPRPTPTQSQ